MIKKYILPILLLACLIFPVSVFGADIYVDATPGEDCSGDYNIATRDCGGATDGDSYQTIDGAVDSGLSAGDTIHIRAGTYTEVVSIGNVSGSSENKITLQNYTGESITIAAGTGSAITLYSHAGYWVIGAQSDRSNFNITATINGDTKVMWFEGSDNACQTTYNCEDHSLYGVYNMTFQNITMAGKFYFVGQDSTFDNIELDGNNQWSNGFYLTWLSTYGNTISNCIVHDYLVRGVELNHVGKSGSPNVIEKSHIYSLGNDVDKAGAGVDIDGYGDAQGSPYNIVRYNQIHDMGEQGVQLENAFYAQIYGNIMYDMVTASNTAAGIFILAYGDDGLEDANLSIAIYDNIIFDCDRGIRAWAGEYVTIANNTFYSNNIQDLWLQQDDLAGGHLCDNYTIKNNIFVEWAAAASAIWLYGDPTGTVFDNNMFYHSNGDAQQTHDDDSSRYTLANWKTAKSAETYDDENSTFADPKFTNAAGDDFTLLPGSPARNAGDTSIDATRLQPTTTFGTTSNGLTMEDITIGAYGVYRGAAGM